MKKEAILIKNLNVFYKKRPIIQNLTLSFSENSLTTIVGPSGCGKSTLLMTITRLVENFSGVRVEGEIKVRLKSGWISVFDLKAEELPYFRRKVVYVSQQPVVLPGSIYRNVAFSLRLLKVPRPEEEERVVEALRLVNLWDEVKDRLKADANSLSGGQQQRLCLARALVLEPEVLLLDEPTAFLDPKNTLKVEELLLKLKEKMTLLVVSHYHDQIKRISDRVIELD